MNELQNPTDDWETKKSKYHTADINKSVFGSYLSKAREAGRITIESNKLQDVLTSLSLADGDVLLNAGAAIFVDSSMNELQIVRFATDERLTILDSKRHTGSILGLAEKAALYISDAMDWRAEFDGSISRKEIPEIPINAIREAIINAFAHRQIESRQAVDISIYKSYIDIYSFGLFPPNLQPEEFIYRIIKPPRRNPLITQTLYYSKDMEGFATWIHRIATECDSAGVKYEFIREDYGFTVRFYRHCGKGWGESNRNVSGLNAGKGPEKGPETKDDEIAVRCATIISEMRSDPKVFRAMLVAKLNLTDKKVLTVLERIKASGQARFEGTGCGGHWVVDD